MRAAVQLKNILSEVMGMSSQGDYSESDNENESAMDCQEETKELEEKVIPCFDPQEEHGLMVVNLN